MAFIKDVKTEETLTYGDILSRYYKLEKVNGISGKNICSARSENLIELRPFERKNSASARIPLTDDYKTYLKEKHQLEGKFLLTDQDGKTLIINNNPLVDYGNSEFISMLEKLNEKYKDAIAEREADEEAYNNFLNSPVPEKDLPKVFYVTRKDISDLNKQDQTDAVMWFVKE